MPSGVYERTPEIRKILSEAHKGKKRGPHPEGCDCGVHDRERYVRIAKEIWERPGHREMMSAIHTGPRLDRRGKRYTEDAVGRYVTKQGYVSLTGQYDHPLVRKNGEILEHRKVLYDEIGPGPHECHWGCGRTTGWGGRWGIQADHLDGNKTNNDLDNLVPSCIRCNSRRALEGNPTNWNPPS